MAGRLYKRCTKCTAELKDPPCRKCGADSYRWAYRVDVGKDSKGQRIQRSRGGFTRKKDAARALRELLRSMDEGRYVEPSKTTLTTYLMEEWLPARKPRRRSAGRGHRGQLGLGTWATYRTDLQAHVIPRIGSIPLQDLAPATLNRLYDELEASGKRVGKCRTAGVTCRKHECSPDRHQGLSPKTVVNVHAVLHKALKDAVKRGKVARNVADAVEPPRADRTRTAVWTVAELRTYLEHVAEDRLYAMWLLFATTGMRRGEVAGLAWPDLDLEAGQVRIDWTLGMVDAKPTWKPRPKSLAGKRTMALDPATVDALRAWRKQQLEEREFAGPAWLSVNTDWRGVSREDLVFTWPNGRMIHPDRISAWFRRHRSASGLPRIRLHDVRHTYATAALANATGWHEVKVISERLGHASIGITIDTYAHVLPKSDQETAETLARLILGNP